MYLTLLPQFTRRWKRGSLSLPKPPASTTRLAWLASMGLLAACTSGVPPRQVQVEPQPLPRDTVVLVAVPVRRILRPEEARYHARATIITRELPQSGTPTADTLVLQESLKVQLVVGSEGQVTLRLQSDSGYRLPMQRSAVPELGTRVRTPIITGASLASGVVVVPSDSSQASCEPTASLASQLLSATWLRAILNMTSEPPTIGDSLAYSYCQAGVRFRTVLTTQSQQERARVGAFPSPHIVATGSFSSDSGRALPMSGAGTIAATFLARPDSAGAILFEELTLRTVSTSNYQSSRRKQSFTQETELILTRQHR